jgi:hypothetical protein
VNERPRGGFGAGESYEIDAQLRSGGDDARHPRCVRYATEGRAPAEVSRSGDAHRGDITNRPYQIIKDIDVTVSKPNVFADDPTQAQVAAELKKRAAEMGADAVIFVRYGALGMGLFNWGEMKGRGRAVVFTATRP